MIATGEVSSVVAVGVLRSNLRLFRPIRPLEASGARLTFKMVTEGGSSAQSFKGLLVGEPERFSMDISRTLAVWNAVYIR